MNEPTTSTREILVRLIDPGSAARDYHLSEDSTLADLLRLAGASTARLTIVVDRTSGEEPWRAVVSAFRDEALFQEYSDVLNARRREGDQEGQDG